LCFFVALENCLFGRIPVFVVAARPCQGGLCTVKSRSAVDTSLPGDEVLVKKEYVSEYYHFRVSSAWGQQQGNGNAHYLKVYQRAFHPTLQLTLLLSWARLSGELEEGLSATAGMIVSSEVRNVGSTKVIFLPRCELAPVFCDEQPVGVR
jgi:hypothetical protein